MINGNIYVLFKQLTRDVNSKRLCSLHHHSDDGLTGDGQDAPARQRSLSSGNWRNREEADLPLFSYSEIFSFTALSKNNNKFQSDV